MLMKVIFLLCTGTGRDFESEGDKLPSSCWTRIRTRASQEHIPQQIKHPLTNRLSYGGPSWKLDSPSSWWSSIQPTCFHCQNVSFGLHYVLVKLSTGYSTARGVQDFPTDGPCGVWCRGLTNCLLDVGPLFGNLVWNNNGFVSLT